MKFSLTIILAFFSLNAMACKSSLLDYNFRKLASSEEVNLCEAYSGKVLLVVNTASKCGFTYQYEGLEKLHDEYSEEGLMVLGFPSNDFRGQEPGTEEEIQDFCRLTYGVEFPMFEKITVTISDHSSRDLLSCVDNAMVLSEGKIVARGTPQELIKNTRAIEAYFGEGFKI